MAAGAAAVVAWAGYVVANLPSRSLPIVAGAVVGGALWAALAWWSGGVLAPLASHILWTGLMLGCRREPADPGSGSVPAPRPEEVERVSFLSTAVQEVLDEGPFCAVATLTPRGPHCTPLVFAASGGRIWLTTSRRSVKARAWRADPGVSGLVRSGGLSVTFTGHVQDLRRARPRNLGRGRRGRDVDRTCHRQLHARRTPDSSRATPSTPSQVPFAWTPPGRVFVGIDLERTALLDERRRAGGTRAVGRRCRVAPDVPHAQAGPRSARRAPRRRSRPRSAAG